MEQMIQHANATLDQALKTNSAAMKDLFSAALGVVIISSAEVGCIVSANMGRGICMLRKRTEDNNNNSKAFYTNQWSAPVAVGLGGLGIGLQVGATAKDVIIFLFGESSCASLVGDLGLKLASQGDISLGSWGRGVDLCVNMSDGGVGGGTAVAFSKGAFLGLSFDSTVLGLRKRVTDKYYNKKGISVKEILLDSPELPMQTSLTEVHEKLERLGKMKRPKIVERRYAFDEEQKETESDLLPAIHYV